MNINVEASASNLRKHLFALKPTRKDGLMLRLHYTLSPRAKERSIRFTQACFDNSGQVLISVTHKGDVFVINFTLSKYWFLMNICSCTVLQFCPCSDGEIIAGLTNGILYVIDVNSGAIISKLLGHAYPVSDISFSSDYLCVTSSDSEAIVWELRNYTKVQVLSLSKAAILKHVMFMPVSNNILACFLDDSIHIWKYGTFELLKQILPASWNKFLVKTIAFTRNGRAMVLGGHSPNVAVFLTDIWSEAKTITLPKNVQGVKKLDFISQPFDGGSNRVLAILSSSGTVYFYDMQLDCVVSEISLDVGVCKFDASSDGKYVACVLTSGPVDIYNLSSYISRHLGGQMKGEVKIESRSKFKMQQAQKSASVMSAVSDKMKNVLDSEKLCAILKEFGQYPDAYRLKIWTQLLQLPNNKEQYNLAINHMSRTSFENLVKEYPIADKVAMNNLKKVLANLVMWCPFFADVAFLPVLVFPFVKLFRNEPVLCFEAVCTVIVNWCQHWFEYYPLPPINVLAMIENVLLEHDPEVLSHLTKKDITAKMYAWPLLETVFSEVLASHDWLILWDHVLSNEPSYILMVVVAYHVIHHNTIVKLSNSTDFEFFYHSQSPVDVKKLIAKSNALLHATSDNNHPRRYLNYFKKLELGPYPPFVDYPKAVVTYQDSVRELKQTSRILETGEDQILRQRQSELDKLKEVKIGLEENIRLEELENVCKLKFEQERELIEGQRRRLENLRRQVHDEEIEILTISRDTLRQKSSVDKQRQLQQLLCEMDQKRSVQDLNLLTAEGELIKHYGDLLRHKQQIEELLNSEECEVSGKEYALLVEQQQKLVEEIDKVQSISNSKQHLKQLNLATGLTAINRMIKKIESELEKQIAPGESPLLRKSNMKQLQLETVELELEVKKLLRLLDHVKANKSNDEVGGFSLLKSTMKKIRDGYEARPPTPI